MLVPFFFFFFSIWPFLSRSLSSTSKHTLARTHTHLHTDSCIVHASLHLFFHLTPSIRLVVLLLLLFSVVLYSLFFGIFLPAITLLEVFSFFFFSFFPFVSIFRLNTLMPQLPVSIYTKTHTMQRITIYLSLTLRKTSAKWEDAK